MDLWGSICKNMRDTCIFYIYIKKMFCARIFRCIIFLPLLSSFMLHIKAHRDRALLYAVFRGKSSARVANLNIVQLRCKCKPPIFFCRAEHGEYSSCMLSLPKYAFSARNLVSDFYASCSM